MTDSRTSSSLRRVTGGPLVLGALTFAVAATAQSVTGFLRWVFVVPLAAINASRDSATGTAVEAARTAQHQFGGALLGEHLGQVLVLGPAGKAVHKFAPGFPSGHRPDPVRRGAPS